jgi:hypothetical protein
LIYPIGSPSFRVAFGGGIRDLPPESAVPPSSPITGEATIPGCSGGASNAPESREAPRRVMAPAGPLVFGAETMSQFEAAPSPEVSEHSRQAVSGDYGNSLSVSELNGNKQVAADSKPSDVGADEDEQPGPDYGNCRGCALLVARTVEVFGDRAVQSAQPLGLTQAELVKRWTRWGGRYQALLEAYVAHLTRTHGVEVSR